MSIINTFDGEGAEIIKAENNVHKIDNFPKTILVAFSTKFCNILLNNYNVSKIGCLYGGGQEYPIYEFECEDKKISMLIETTEKRNKFGKSLEDDKNFENMKRMHEKVISDALLAAVLDKPSKL